MTRPLKAGTRTALLTGTCLSLVTACTVITPHPEQQPADFVSVHQVLPQVQLDIRYAGKDNFMGTPVDGYAAPVALLSADAATALARAAALAREQGYLLRVYDAYRPQAAVDHFLRWAEDKDDLHLKAAYYPHLDKNVILQKGYIARRSSHSRGSTVDLTLVSEQTGETLDMGSDFDYFDPLSHHDAPGLTPVQQQNRKQLLAIMQASGFKAFPHEWWHYTLEDEPYPDTYFNFTVREPQR